MLWREEQSFILHVFFHATIICEWLLHFITSGGVLYSKVCAKTIGYRWTNFRFDSEKDSDLFARLVLVLANCEAGSPLTWITYQWCLLQSIVRVTKQKLAKNMAILSLHVKSPW
jgi:hypothetical protein